MRYYEINFNATDELASSWGISEISCDDDSYEEVLCQSFYVKSDTSIDTKEQMKNHLLANFKPSTEYGNNLINCIYPSTANEIHSFYEIDADEFESCCGIHA